MWVEWQASNDGPFFYSLEGSSGADDGGEGRGLLDGGRGQWARPSVFADSNVGVGAGVDPNDASSSSSSSSSSGLLRGSLARGSARKVGHDASTPSSQHPQGGVSGSGLGGMRRTLQHEHEQQLQEAQQQQQQSLARRGGGGGHGFDEEDDGEGGGGDEDWDELGPGELPLPPNARRQAALQQQQKQKQQTFGPAFSSKFQPSSDPTPGDETALMAAERIRQTYRNLRDRDSRIETGLDLREVRRRAEGATARWRDFMGSATHALKNGDDGDGEVEGEGEGDVKDEDGGEDSEADIADGDGLALKTMMVRRGRSTAAGPGAGGRRRGGVVAQVGLNLGQAAGLEVDFDSMYRFVCV